MGHITFQFQSPLHSMTKEKASYFGVCGMKAKKNQNVFVIWAGYLLKDEVLNEMTVTRQKN